MERFLKLFAHWHFALVGFRVAATLTFAVVACGLRTAADSVDPNTALSSALRDDLSAYLKAHGTEEHISTIAFSVNFPNDSKSIDLAVGTTQYGGGVSVTPSNLFQLGSQSKAFTAVAILQLEAAGMLSIHDTVGKWLPHYPAWSKITIQQLLNMSGGISSYEFSPEFQATQAADPNHNFAPAELVGYIYPRFKPPGKQFEYSNTGYILAQMIIEKAAASHSYQAEIDRILASVDLSNTFYKPNVYPSLVALRLVSGYFTDDGPDYTGVASLLGKDTSRYSLSSAQAAGGIVGTAHDLAKWARALYQSAALLAPAQRTELMAVVSSKTGQPIAHTTASDPGSFGLGVTQVYDKTLGPLWNYEGATLGFRSYYLWFPSQDVAFALTVNSWPRVDHISEAAVSVIGTLKKAGKL